MVAQRDRGDEPIIPKPELTPSALRKAVATVVPSRLDEFREDLEKHVAMASEEGSLTPIRAFYIQWGAIVEMERFPETARRLHAAERAVNDGDPDTSARAIREAGDIVRAAYREVLGE